MIQVQSTASSNTTPASTANSRPDAKEVRSMIAMIRTMETDNTRKVRNQGAPVGRCTYSTSSGCAGFEQTADSTLGPADTVHRRPRRSGHSRSNLGCAAGRWVRRAGRPKLDTSWPSPMEHCGHARTGRMELDMPAQGPGPYRVGLPWPVQGSDSSGQQQRHLPEGTGGPPTEPRARPHPLTREQEPSLPESTTWKAVGTLQAAGVPAPEAEYGSEDVGVRPKSTN